MVKTAETDRRATREPMKNVYFFEGVWSLVYVAASVAISVILLIFVLFPSGLSVTSDTVFGSLAMVSGVSVDVVLRRHFNRRVLISSKLPAPILYVWIPLCLYVLIAHPFESP